MAKLNITNAFPSAKFNDCQRPELGRGGDLRYSTSDNSSFERLRGGITVGGVHIVLAVEGLDATDIHNGLCGQLNWVSRIKKRNYPGGFNGDFHVLLPPELEILSHATLSRHCNSLPIVGCPLLPRKSAVASPMGAMFHPK